MIYNLLSSYLTKKYPKIYDLIEFIQLNAMFFQRSAFLMHVLYDIFLFCSQENWHQKENSDVIFLTSFLNCLSQFCIWTFRYVAIIHPLLHRNLSVKYSVKQRVVFYTLPVVVVSVFVNIPKFLETKVVATQKREELQGRVSKHWQKWLWNRWTLYDMFKHFLKIVLNSFLLNHHFFLIFDWWGNISYDAQFSNKERWAWPKERLKRKFFDINYGW